MDRSKYHFTAFIIAALISAALMVLTLIAPRSPKRRGQAKPIGART